MFGRRTRDCLVAACAALLSVGRTTAQTMGTAPAPGLFGATAPLELTLTTDLRAVTKDRGSERTYHNGVLSYVGPGGVPVTLDVRVLTRGIFRLQPAICQFPPLLLDFPTRAPPHTIFASQDRLKLATHCQNHRDEYEQYILQEYLIYRVYNVLTERSFQTRLTRITYVDSAGRDAPLTKYGFLIEDERDLAGRSHATPVRINGLLQDNIDHANMGLVAVFQYMIGNTDWSVWGRHNIKLLRDSNSVLYAVPYDFDWAGVIATAYAKPDARLPIRSVRQRLFRGTCRTPEELAAAFAPFVAQKDTIYALYANEPALQAKGRDQALRYYDEFYKTIEDPRAVKREFLQRCGNRS